MVKMVSKLTLYQIYKIRFIAVKLYTVKGL